MKKIFLTICAAIVFFLKGNSQAIPNAGFENWLNMGTYEDPQGWATLNSVSNFGYPVFVTKTTDAYSGTYAIMLNTVSFIDPFTNAPDSMGGIALTGQMPGNFIIPGFPFTQRPVDLKGYYKYSPASGDSAFVFVTLTKWDTVSNSQTTIGEGIFFTDIPATSYTGFQIPIIYYSAAAPDSAVIYLFSGGNIPKPGSELKVDELAFTLPAGTEEWMTSTSVFVFPNPFNLFTIIHFGFTANHAELNIYNLCGQKVKAINQISDDEIKVERENLNSGLYIYELKQNGHIISTGKLLITD